MTRNLCTGKGLHHEPESTQNTPRGIASRVLGYPCGSEATRVVGKNLSVDKHEVIVRRQCQRQRGLDASRRGTADHTSTIEADPRGRVMQHASRPRKVHARFQIVFIHRIFLSARRSPAKGLSY